MTNNDIDHQNNMSTNSNFEDKDNSLRKCRKLDNKFSSKNVNVSSTLKKHLVVSSTTTETNDKPDKFIETEVSCGSNKLNQTESKILINVLKSDVNCADINTQDENLIVNLTKKNMNNISPLTIKEMNTQQFMELNLCRAQQQFQPSQQHQDVSKNQTTEHMDSDESIIITPPNNELKHTELNNKNILTVNIPNKSEKHNNSCKHVLTFSTQNEVPEFFTPNENPELSIQNEHSELSNQNQDSEIVAFQAMCETMSRIKTFGNNEINDKNNVNVAAGKNNQPEHLVYKKINPNEICIVGVECSPSTSRLNAAVTEDILKLKCSTGQKHQCYSIDSSTSSTESLHCLNALPQNQYNFHRKKMKSISLQNTSKSSIDRTVIKSNGSNQIDLFIVSSEDEKDQENCKVIKKKLPEIKMYNRKRMNVDSLEQKKPKRSREYECIFQCSPDGLIHEDMLEYIKRNNFNC